MCIMKRVIMITFIILFQVYLLSMNNMAEKSEKSETGDVVERLISGLTDVLKVQQGKVTHLRAPKLSRFSGKYAPGELLLSEWLDEVDIYCNQCDIPASQKAQVILNHLDGEARQEIKCHAISSDELDCSQLINLLKRHFGSKETSQSLLKKFHERIQHENESLDQYSRILICMYNDIIKVAPSGEKKSYQDLKDSSLIDKFVQGTRNPSVRLELRRIQLASPGKTFLEIRDHALDLLDSFDTRPKRHGSVYEVSVDDSSERAGSMAMHTDRDLIKHLVQQQAALEQCVRQQQTMLEQQQAQLSELLAQGTRVPSHNQRRIPTCFHCGKVGHIQAKCWELQNEMQNRNYNSQTTGDLNDHPPL